MKRPAYSPMVLLLTLSLSLTAQVRPGGGNPDPNGSADRNPTSIPDPRTDGPDTLPSVLYVSGKVVADDGNPITDRVIIQSNCEGTVRTEGYADRKGTFSFEFGTTKNSMLSEAAPATDTTNTTNLPGVRRENPHDWRKCELKAVSSGFTSQVVDLSTKAQAFGDINIGNITLHRIVPVQGLTISANALQAPVEARKRYEKGLEEKNKGNLEGADQQFRKAVDAYPKYSVAWLELGRVQIAKKDIAGARQSFHQSIAADDKLMGPYQELTQLAAHDKQWQEVADNTDQLLKLNPAEFPEFWFYNCVAKYQLGNLDGAENSARQGVKIDTEHRIPKMEYVLGQILVAKGDYPGAAEHLREYLSLLPNGPDAADAQKKLNEVEKLR